MNHYKIHVWLTKKPTEVCGVFTQWVRTRQGHRTLQTILKTNSGYVKFNSRLNPSVAEKITDDCVQIVAGDHSICVCNGMSVAEQLKERSEVA